MKCIVGSQVGHVVVPASNSAAERMNPERMDWLILQNNDHGLIFKLCGDLRRHCEQEGRDLLL